MPQETLAKKIRAKYPGTYDDLSDQDLEAKVKAKYPGVYDDIPTTTADSSGTEQQSGTLPTGSPIARLLNAGANALNPMPIVQALSSPQATGEAIQGIVDQARTRGGEAVEAFRQGNYSQAVDRGIGAIPIVGPAIESLAGKVDEGNYAGALGEAAALAIPPPGPRGAAGVRTPSPMALRAAEVAARMGEQRMTNVIAPKVGANKVRFGNMAADVAPRLAREEGMGALTREGLAGKVAEKFESAKQELNNAVDARNAGNAFPTAPLIAKLQEKIDALTAEAVEGSRPQRTETTRTSPIVDERGNPIQVTEQKTKPVGKDVVPEDNRTRVAKIQEAIRELQQLGPVARYESIRRIRQSFDQPARIRYSPSMTSDFLKKSGEASGAADVTGVLRENLGDMDKATAKANQAYSFWNKVDDVLSAAEETERVRPNVMRGLMARTAGAVAGGVTGGDMTSAVLGAVILGGTEKALSSGVTMQIALSRQLAKLEDALRAGKASAARAEIIRYAQMTGQTAKLNALLAGGEQSRRSSKTESTPSLE